VSTVAFATLGCRLNQVDTQEMQARLAARGFRTVPFEDPADVVVVNSCTVTARADFSDRQMVRRAARTHPGARVVVTGCWAQTNPAAAVATGADLVVGNADKHRIAELLEALAADTVRRPARIEVTDIAAARALPPAPVPHAAGRSRAFVKIQEGCQHRCAFCIVPRARGASRSRPPELVVEHVERLVAAGHPEIVLTGVDLGHYGADLTPRTSLAMLLRALADLRGLRWLRLSSLLPAYLTEDLLDLVATAPVIAPHFHVPLQSGSDRVLRLMRRPYNVRMYRRVVERLVARPEVALGADVIVGFPGEIDDDFAETVRVIDELPFSYLHVFGYSDRDATEAATLPHRVDPATIARRSELLRARSADKARAFRARLVGRTMDVLVLEKRDRVTGHLVGLTGNYVEVVFAGPDSRMRRLARVRVTDAGDERATGEAA
jgi:threonylcarbamoyladenosine tRNA methylthiotransferase MtaB